MVPACACGPRVIESCRHSWQHSHTLWQPGITSHQRHALPRQSTPHRPARSASPRAPPPPHLPPSQCRMHTRACATPCSLQGSDAATAPRRCTTWGGAHCMRAHASRAASNGTQPNRRGSPRARGGLAICPPQDAVLSLGCYKHVYCIMHVLYLLPRACGAVLSSFCSEGKQDLILT
jgi:hypothetical protein